MNKKILYAFIAGSMLSLSSCNDFLDVTPASGFTPEYVFSSEEEMKSLMTRIYSSMTEDGLYGSNLAILPVRISVVSIRAPLGER